MLARSAVTSLALALALTLAGQPCPHGFSAPDRVVNGWIESAAWGDLNQDGRVDVAFTTVYGLGAALNRGNGVFEPVSRQWLPTEFPHARVRVVTDVDRDGRADLLIATTNTGTTLDGWARGRGDGTFERPVRLAISNTYFEGARLYDFDGDGIRDIVAYTRDEVHFFHAVENAPFSFTRQIRFSYRATEQERIVVGDFDGDGNVDAARIAYNPTASRGGASVIWSASSARPVFTEIGFPFAPASTFEPLDVDGDGAEELLGLSDGLRIVGLRDRTVTHQAMPFSHEPGKPLRHPAVADMDGDGRRDLVFAYGWTVAVAKGGETNRFSEPVVLGFGGSSRFALADIDGNGAADIAATSGPNGLAVIYAGSAIFTPASQRVFPLAFTPRDLQRADLDGDGQVDVVVGGEGMTVSALLNDRGTFRPTSTRQYAPAHARSLLSSIFVADFDGDGLADVATGLADERSIQPFAAFGDGRGNFTGVPIDAGGGRLVGALRTASAAASLLVLHGGEVRLLQITRAGAVTTSTLFTAPENASVIAFDLDGDALDEIAVGSASGIDIRKLTGGTWQKVHELQPSFSHLVKITTADFNGDHVSDLLVRFVDDVRVDFRTGSGFDASHRPGSAVYLDDVAAADVDRDGHTDLIVASRGSFGDPGLLQVRRNDGTGQFTPYNTALTTPSFGASTIAADVDGDGAIDVVRPSFDGVELHRNVCGTPRVRVATLPPRVTTSTPVRLVIHGQSTDAFSVGVITVKLNGAMVAQHQPNSASEHAIFVWTSEPLPKGRHTVTIEYADQWAGTSTTEVVIEVEDAPARRRAVRK